MYTNYERRTNDPFIKALVNVCNELNIRNSNGYIMRPEQFTGGKGVKITFNNGLITTIYINNEGIRKISDVSFRTIEDARYILKRMKALSNMYIVVVNKSKKQYVIHKHLLDQNHYIISTDRGKLLTETGVVLSKRLKKLDISILDKDILYSSKEQAIEAMNKLNIINNKVNCSVVTTFDYWN